MTGQFKSIMTGVSRHIGKSPRSAYVQRLVLPEFPDRMYPVPECGGMMAARLLERPIDEILDIGEDERRCDSTTVDNTVRPFRVISQCSKPAEWIYVMKCCGVQALACDRAMSNIYSARFTSVTAPTARIRSAPWPTARVPCIGCRGMAMRLDEAIGVITDTELMRGYRRDGIAARVNDVYSIKPIDRDTLVDAVRDTRGRLVIAEDHRPEGGRGSAVIEFLVGKDTHPLRLAHPAVRIMPGSGTPTELLAAAAIDAASIDSAARHLLDGTHRESDRQDASTPPAQRRSAGPT